MSVSRPSSRGPSRKAPDRLPEEPETNKRTARRRNLAANKPRRGTGSAAATAQVTARQAAPAKADPIRMITFNTAVGNPKIKTPQEAFLQLPFYQDVIQGRPNAPIVNLQEVGPRQLEALQAAEKKGNFRMFYIGRPGGSQGGQYNVMLIPNRFEVVAGDSHYFGGAHAKGLAKSVFGWAKGGFKGKPPSQWVEPRMWTNVRLKDKQSGKVFTVMNTHLSTDPNIRLEQARKLRDEVVKAKKHGPVVLAGDLNVRAPGERNSDPRQNATDEKVRKLLWTIMKDMGANQEKMDKPNIDFVLGTGFTSKSTNIYQGTELSLPGLPTADKISDHYAEENVLEFT